MNSSLPKCNIETLFINCLKYVLNLLRYVQNLFKVCSSMTCIDFQLILHTDPYTSMTFSGKRLPGSLETFPWHLILAPRNHILEKGNQINP